MIRLISQVRLFIKSDFHPSQYSLVVLLVGALIATNYFIIPIETVLINHLPAGAMRAIGYFGLYSIAYYTAIAITLKAKNRLSTFNNRTFWTHSLIAVVVFSMDSGFWLPQFVLKRADHPPQTYNFYHTLISNGKGLITISFILLLVNASSIRNKAEKLGTSQSETIKPFLFLLALITPFIFISSLDSGLGSYYPTFKYFNIASQWNSPAWVPPLVYELIYGIDFFNIEFFFRGFLIIGLSSTLGRDAILPMAVFYCTIHFGKPMMECISSFFGGYILGAIAFQMRSIWGGVIMHVGVAWMMEISAFVKKFSFFFGDMTN